MNGYTITTDKSVMQPEAIHGWLSQSSYWAKNIPYGLFLRSLEHSFCAGVFYEGQQVGFGRLVTDYAVFAYLADVFILEAHRGKGLSKRLVSALVDEPEWTGQLRKIMLATLDAHELYRQFGFTELAQPERLMERAGKSYPAL